MLVVEQGHASFPAQHRMLLTTVPIELNGMKGKANQKQRGGSEAKGTSAGPIENEDAAG